MLSPFARREARSDANKAQPSGGIKTGGPARGYVLMGVSAGVVIAEDDGHSAGI